MGISLRNLTKKINPFYQANPVSNAAPMQQKIQNARYGVLANNPTAQQSFVRQAQVPHPSVVRGINTAGESFGDALFHTSQDFVTRPAAEIVSTIRNKPYNPGSAFEQTIFGKNPVAPIQQKVSDQYARQRASSNAAIRTLSAPLAVGEGLLSAANDAPLVGGLVKGATRVGKAVVGLKGVKEAAQTTKIPVSVKPGPRTSSIPVKVNKRISVKSLPSKDELVNNYNAHMSILNKQYSAGAKPVTLAGNKGVIAEPSVYNDVGYQAKKQAIEQAYKDGTLSKPIPVKDAPKPTKAKVALVKEEMKGITRSPTDLKPSQEKAAVAELNSVTPGKVSNTDRVTRSAESILGRIDPRLGNGVAQRREIGETGAAVAKSRLKITDTLTKEEETNWVDALEGKAKPINNKVAQAVEETRAEDNRVNTISNKVGIDAPYRENHFPHIHDPKTFQEGTTQNQQAINHLVQSGQAKNPTEAAQALRDYSENHIYGAASTKTSPYKNLTESRTLNLPGYAKSVKAYKQYLDRAYASIAHAHVFGAKDEKLNAILDEVGRGGGTEAYGQAVRSYRQASGLDRGSGAAQNLSRGLTTVQGATKLGTSSVGNVTQLTNTVVAGGARRTAAAQYKILRDAGTKDFVKKTGVTDEEVSHEALFGEQGIAGSGKLRQATAPLFEQVERNNRAVTAVVGRDVANDLAKRAVTGDAKALSRLKKEFGIDNVGKDGLTEGQQIKAARVMVSRTQFRTGAQDLPGWASTNWGRVITQFKRYPYKQSQFLWNEVMQPALKGNVKPLGRWLAISVPVALGANEVRQKIRGDNFSDAGAKAAIDAFSNATGGDLTTGLINQLYPNSKDSNSYISKAVKTVSGPTGSDIVKATQAGFDATQGKFANAERFGLSHIPTVGPTVSNALVPYPNSTPKAGTPAAKKGDATKELADLKKNVKEGYSLQQLSDGRYAYNLDGVIHTATSYKKASRAIARDSFDKSDDQEKTVNGIYYYKDANGDVHTKIASSKVSTPKTTSSKSKTATTKSKVSLMPTSSTYSVKNHNARINNAHVTLKTNSSVKAAYKAPSVKLKKTRTKI